jgi:hypothetical protein
MTNVAAWLPLLVDEPRSSSTSATRSYNETAVQLARQAWRDAYAAARQHESSNNRTTDAEPQRCAIHLYGLPRAFDSLVLPSLQRHVLTPNALYECDYFVHYYNLTSESAGRSGAGGMLDPHEIRASLPAALRLLHPPNDDTMNTSSRRRRTPVVHFAMDQEEDFWKRHETLLHQIDTSMDAQGRPRYHPWADRSYTFPATVHNIMKMWHSIQESWSLMEAHAAQEGIRYTRVAMLRSDVVYMTPVDIWERGTAGKYDDSNRVAVIPGFAKFPVSDRMIYGPFEAVQIWAATRFARLEEHVRWAQEHQPGMALHSESFVWQLLVTMRAQGLTVDEHDTLCFFRARVDESVWITDCDNAPLYASPLIQQVVPANRRAAVEAVLGRPCTGAVRAVLTGSNALSCPA